MNNGNIIRPKTARELGIMQGFPPPPEKRPSLENWDLAPFNRWTFQNIRSLFPTVEVRRGLQEASEFEKSLIDLSNMKFTNFAGNEKDFDSFLEETYTDGMLVYANGKLIFEHYANDMHPETPHLSQSVAKTIVGAVAGILLENGTLERHALLKTYVPELAVCGYGDATLDHVLSMQAGVQFTEDYGLPHSDMTRVDVACGWRPALAGSKYESIRDIILTLPKVREHGEVFDYRSIETDVIAWVLERVSGESLPNLVSRLIWQSMGAERDGFFTVDRHGTALADGGFNATLRDYARFGRLILNAGKTGAPDIVPLSWVKDCQKGDAGKFHAPYINVTPNGAYKNKWWIRDVDRGDIAARGVFGQMIYVDRENDYLVVKLSSWPDYVIPEYTIDTFLAIDAIRNLINSPA